MVRNAFSLLFTLLVIVAIAGLVYLSTSNSNSIARVEDEKVVIVEESMHEFMEYYFQPTYKRLKTAMATEPENNNSWRAIKADALILAEGGNLLLSHHPEKDEADWMSQSIDVRKSGGELYQAARAKDFAAATTSYHTMIENCNTCHKQFEDGKHILVP